MNVNHILVLIIRLFAIGLFVYALNNSMFLTAMMVSPQSAFKLNFLLMPAVHFLIVIVLWCFPNTVIAKLTSEHNIETGSEFVYKSFEIIDAMFIIFGLFLILRVVSDGLFWFILIQYDSSASFDANQKAGIVSTIIEAMIVVWILFFRKTIYFYLKYLKR